MDFFKYRSNEIRSDEIRSNEIRSNEIRSNKICMRREFPAISMGGGNLKMTSIVNFSQLILSDRSSCYDF